MKSVLITGGSRGIGRATALQAGQQGWFVGVNYVGNDAAARETAEAVEKAGGQAMVCVAMSLGNPMSFPCSMP